MYRNANTPMPHLATPTNITTINYTLEWSYLSNPSNNTFAGPTQIDICKCPRSDLPQQQKANKQEQDEQPGHIYTRFACTGPRVRFPNSPLWVLEAPHGPINMLRPATRSEFARRNEIHDGAEPAVYAGRNFLLLTGPCPRGRYQAYATLHFLKALSSEARANVESLSLLVQPYEEDCVDENCTRAYAELAEYMVNHLPGFRTLWLNIWDDEMRLRRAAKEVNVLLQREGVRIVVGCSWWRGKVKEYSSAKSFLEAVDTMLPGKTKKWRFELEELEGSVVWRKGRGREGGGGEGNVRRAEGVQASSTQDGDDHDNQNQKSDIGSKEDKHIDTPSSKSISDTQAEASTAKPSSQSPSDTKPLPQASEHSTPTQETHLSHEDNDDDDDWTDATSWEVL